MNHLKDVNILVVGDIMLDKYVIGDVRRISPEAPVPVVNVEEEYSTLGGCGNVVRNLVELGVNTFCLSSVGYDENGHEIRNQLKELKVEDYTISESVVTTVKERIIASYRDVQILRIDRENIEPIDHNMLIERICEIFEHHYVDFVIVSDYAKGMISEELMKYIFSWTKNVIVDPKPEHDSMYNGAYMITPNKDEWTSMQFSSRTNFNNVKYILETKGKEGMTLHSKNQSWDIPSTPVEIYNVSGAGDTVIAVVSACLTIGINPLTSAKIANDCARYVVTQPGTSVIPRNKFTNYIDKYLGG